MKRVLLNELNPEATLSFLERPDINYKITKDIGRGASCIVYHAICSDDTEHLLKEYYPKNLALNRDGTGSLIIPEDKYNDFQNGLVQFRYGCERQKTVRLSNEGLKNFTSNVQGYFSANGTEYIDMTCFSGRTYDTVQEKSIYELMVRVRTLTQVVGNYHKNGLLHLDIKPENIYVRPETEMVEDIMLFDFDSVTAIKDVNRSKTLSCTKAWAAPEQLQRERRHSICFATDLFAIGEIIFVQLFGRHSTNAERRSFVTGYSYDTNAEIFKNVHPKVYPLLDELLTHTICGVVEKRYQSAEELIGKLDAVIDILASLEPYLISNVSVNEDIEITGEKTLNKIHERLSDTGRYFLKSTPKRNLAGYIKQYIKFYHDAYDTIIYLDLYPTGLSNDFERAYGLKDLIEDIPIENCSFKGRKPIYEQIFDELDRLCDEKVLIVIDNFHAGYLVDHESFNMLEVRGICKRLHFLQARILINGNFDTDCFQDEHWYSYCMLLQRMAEKCYESGDYDHAEEYAAKAVNIAKRSDMSLGLKRDCLELLNQIHIDRDWNICAGFFDDENEFDVYLNMWDWNF